MIQCIRSCKQGDVINHSVGKAEVVLINILSPDLVYVHLSNGKKKVYKSTVLVELYNKE